MCSNGITCRDDNLHSKRRHSKRRASIPSPPSSMFASSAPSSPRDSCIMILTGIAQLEPCEPRAGRDSALPTAGDATARDGQQLAAVGLDVREQRDQLGQERVLHKHFEQHQARAVRGRAGRSCPAPQQKTSSQVGQLPQPRDRRRGVSWTHVPEDEGLCSLPSSRRAQSRDAAAHAG